MPDTTTLLLITLAKLVDACKLREMKLAGDPRASRVSQSEAVSRYHAALQEAVNVLNTIKE